MNDEKQETRADIVREMRILGKLDEKSTDKIPRSLMGRGRRTYADRLEAAAKRESNNAATMREALEPWIAFAEWLLENAGKDGLGKAIQENGPIIRQRLEELRAALSAPPRNCDVGTAEEQEKRFDAWVQDRRGDLDCTGKCPAHHGVDFGVVNCVLQWAQMPYEVEEGGAL
ncbi:MAG: hypothetical protein IKO55_11710 [Kiritimatiellae bacterium]|nr:hypothetical protein [Kiritimatiellia bacterium]